MYLEVVYMLDVETKGSCCGELGRRAVHVCARSTAGVNVLMNIKLTRRALRSLYDVLKEANGLGHVHGCSVLYAQQAG